MTTETTAIEEYQGYDEEEGSLGRSVTAIRVPRMRYSGKSGTFQVVGVDGDTPVLTAVPIMVMPDTRIKWPESDDDDGSGKNEIECRSNDNNRPVSVDQARAIGAGGATNDSCRACPYSQFTTGANGKRKPPLCTLFKNIALADAVMDAEPTINEAGEEEVAQPLPFLFAYKATSIRAVETALDQIQIEQGRTRPQRAAYTFVLELRAGSIAGEGKRKYYPLTVRVTPQRVPAELWGSYRALWQWMAELKAQRLIDYTDESTAEQAPAADQVVDPEYTAVHDMPPEEHTSTPADMPDEAWPTEPPADMRQPAGGGRRGR